MIIKTTSHIIKKIWIAFLVIILTLIVLILFLMHGINIDSISLPKLKIKELYIKLDKKLIVKANKIEILRESKSKSSTYEVYKLAQYSKYLNQFFQIISLKHIKYDNEIVDILYKDDVFYLNSNYLSVGATLKSITGKKLSIDLKHMILKDLKLGLSGKVNLDFQNNAYDYSGKFDILNVNGQINLKIKQQKAYYRVKTKTFTTLVPLMKFIESKVTIEPTISDWIYKNIVAKSYKLDNLQGMFNLKTKNFYPNLMSSKATLKNAFIKFDSKVAPAMADEIEINLKNDALSFNLKNPTYEDKKIKINDIHIYNLFADKSGIIVDLNSTSLLDAPINAILKAFEINIPIKQTSGTNESNVYLDIKFNPFSVDAKGDFIVKNSNLLIDGNSFFTKYAKIGLLNNSITLSNSNIKYSDLFDIDTNGTLDLDTKIYSGLFNINSLNLSLNNNSLLSIKNLYGQSVKLSLEDNASVFIFKDLDTKLSFTKNYNEIYINNLAKFRDFSPFMMDYNLSDGEFYIKTQDFKNFNGELKLDNLTTPLYFKNKEIKSLDINIKTDADKFYASTKDEKIKLLYNKGFILNIKDLDILVDSTKKKGDITSNFLVKGKNINFNIKDSNFTIPSDNFTLILKPKSTNFISAYKKSKISYKEQNKSYTLNITGLDDTLVNKALNSKIFKGGLFGMSANGSSTKALNGQIFIQNSTLMGSALFNNIMQVINTVPSLSLFRNADVNKNGYPIKNGRIDFKKIAQIITFSKIKLDGYNNSISGLGHVDLEKSNIDLDLEIRILKSISEIVDKIPVVGHIILGDDKSISTKIKVSGPLKNPKIDTQLFKDVTLTPVDIIKRTIESPLRLFK